MSSRQVSARYLADVERGVVDDATRLVEQLKIIGKEEGIRVTDLADLLQVDRRSLTYWASGENQPSTENYNALKTLRDHLLNEPDAVRAELNDGVPIPKTHPIAAKSIPTDT